MSKVIDLLKNYINDLEKGVVSQSYEDETAVSIALHDTIKTTINNFAQSLKQISVKNLSTLLHNL